MSTFDIVPFRLGAATSRKRNVKLTTFYETLAKLVVGETVQRAPVESTFSVITAKEVIEHPQNIYVILFECIYRTSHEANAIILDLSVTTKAIASLDTIPGSVYRHIAHAIGEAMSDEWPENKKFIMRLIHAGRD
jgi:2-polyprenyl-3-methyl-5-hydroxy-6-metoxy-1,4-benzoquinol methylase